MWFLVEKQKEQYASQARNMKTIIFLLKNGVVSSFFESIKENKKG